MAVRFSLCLLVLPLLLAACGGGSGAGAIKSPFLLWEEPLPEGVEFMDYSAELGTTGGLGSMFTWRVAVGNLPDGLRLEPATPHARITGIPLAEGVYTFTIEAFDAENNLARRQFSITIAPLGPHQIAIKTLALPVCCTGQPCAFDVVGAGGTASGYQWTIVGGGLPTGLTHTTLGTPHCTIAGTPLIAGEYSFTIRLQDSAGAVATRALTMRVATPGTIVTFAGSPQGGFAGNNGPAARASLYTPTSVACDSEGNVYIADFNNNRVRKVDARTGIISTFAGTGTSGFGGDGGPASMAQLFNPISIAVDAQDNLYICTVLTVRKVDAVTGIIETIAGSLFTGYTGDGGPALGATFSQAHGIALDASGNLYIADTFNHRVRRVDAATGIIETVAGVGTGGGTGGTGDGGDALQAELDEPRYVAVDSQGNLYIAEWGYSGKIRRVDATTGIIDGVAWFIQPEGLAIGPGDQLYAVDSQDPGAYRVNVVTHGALTIAGTGTQGFGGDGGPAPQALLRYPAHLCFDPVGNMYIADMGNHRVRKVFAP